MAHSDDLSASARLITDAVSSSVEVASGGERRAARRAHPFRHAYAQLVLSVPKENRLPLLRQMASNIEALAEKEGEGHPTSKNAYPEFHVSTDDFMAGLMRDEKSQWEKDIASKLDFIHFQRRL